MTCYLYLLTPPYEKIPPQSIRVPKELTDKVTGYQDWLNRPSVGLFENP